MLSWKQKKLRLEKNKSKRKAKVYDISHASKEYMKAILDGEREIEDRSFKEMMKKLIWRSVFNKK